MPKNKNVGENVLDIEVEEKVQFFINDSIKLCSKTTKILFEKN